MSVVDVRSCALRYAFIGELNDNQRQAATTFDGPLLLLAGAGSGKTKTIIARTALLVAMKQARPREILVMTFTNKAAGEMKERGKALLARESLDVGEPAIFSTFHSWGNTFLRKMPGSLLAEFGLTNEFGIADDNYQDTILKRLIPLIWELKDADLKKYLTPRNLMPFFTICHTNFVRYETLEQSCEDVAKLFSQNPENIDKFYPRAVDEKVLESFGDLYYTYKQTLRKNNTVDFDDLIMLPFIALSKHKILRDICHKSYKYIMVDEFQDTDNVQFALVRQLINPSHNNICVVGDDAQSIYSFRGAEVNLILNFHNEFEETKIINLDINYRSNAEIVDRSNLLLAHQKNKHHDKEILKPNKQQAGVVKAYSFDYSNDEATFVARHLKKQIESGVSPNNIAILYRNNIISRKLEEELLPLGIPYKLYNAKELLDREAAKLILSYLKYIYNPSDDILLATLLVGLNLFTANRLAEVEAGLHQKSSLYDFLKSKKHHSLTRFTKKEAVDRFIRDVEGWIDMPQEDLEDFEIFREKFVKENYIVTLYEIALDDAKKADNLEKIKAIESNLRVASSIYVMLEKYRSLGAFLEAIALDNQKEDKDELKNQVHLMTAHRAKGLEWDIVYVFGFSNGLFPSSKAITGKDLEEERRLAYVALTRAKEKLYITNAKSYYGSENRGPSPFLKEIGVEARVIKPVDSLTNSRVGELWKNKSW